MMKTKFKIVMLYILSFVCSVAPALIFFLVNHKRYISTIPDRIKISAGIIALIVIIVLKLLGKLKINSRIAVFGTVFALSYLLEAILNDLLVFSFLALVGEGLELIVGIFIKREKRKALLKESAEANAQELEKVITRVSGR